jgi:hypothetical protein
MADVVVEQSHHQPDGTGTRDPRRVELMGFAIQEPRVEVRPWRRNMLPLPDGPDHPQFRSLQSAPARM